jgi:uncharacterized protein (DUF1330 family)
VVDFIISNFGGISMAGYWVVRGGEIKDPSALATYSELWPPIAARYGAEIIAGKGKFETREGPDYPRQLIVRFDSYQQALDCYEDQEYQAAKELVHRAYDRELSIVEG